MHFGDDCFEVDSALASPFGMKKRRRLKPGAVPTKLRYDPAGTFSMKVLWREDRLHQVSNVIMEKTTGLVEIFDSAKLSIFITSVFTKMFLEDNNSNGKYTER